MKEITIEWLYDEHYCETCGTATAMGARVKKGGKMLMEWMPIANCFGGDDWQDTDVYKGILKCLGYNVSEVHHD